MKKFLKIAFVIILAVGMLYAYNIYSGGALVQTINNLKQTQITTTNIYKSSAIENNSTQTLSAQVHSELSADEQKVFDIIYDGLSAYKSSVNIYQEIESDRIFELVELVLAEHPEIFWSKGDCSFSTGGRLTFAYPYTKNETQEKNALIENRAKKIFKEINILGDDYEKSKAIFDYITLNTSYAAEEAENIDENLPISTIEGVFLDGEAVCSGYAKAYQYLLSMAGIDAVTISGDARTPTGNARHAWTAQVIDGEVYFSDATWGDGFENAGNSDFVSHTYFLMNSEEIEKTHSCQNMYSAIKSTAQKDYFVREGLFFDAYDLSGIRTKVKESLDNKELGTEFKFADSQAYEEACAQLFDNENIYLVLKSSDPFSSSIDTSRINYSCDDTHNTITIFFNYK